MEPLIALGLASNIIQIADFSGRLFSRSKEIYTSTGGTLSVYTDLEDAAKNLQELTSYLDREEKGHLSQQAEREMKDRQKREKDRKLREKLKLKEKQKARARKGRPPKTEDMSWSDQELLSDEVNDTAEMLETKRAKRKAKKEMEEATERRWKLEAETRNRQADQKYQETTRKNMEADNQLLTLSNEAKNVTKKIVDAVQKLKSSGGDTKFQSVRQAFRSIWSEPELKSLECSLDKIRSKTDTALLFSVR